MDRVHIISRKLLTLLRQTQMYPDDLKSISVGFLRPRRRRPSRLLKVFLQTIGGRARARGQLHQVPEHERRQGRLSGE